MDDTRENGRYQKGISLVVPERWEYQKDIMDDAKELEI